MQANITDSKKDTFDVLGISDFQTYLFNTGKNYQSYKMLGVHKIVSGAKSGYRFAVYAPNAKNICLIGEFNDWNGKDFQLTMLRDTGIWVGFFDNVYDGQMYKYRILGSDDKIYDKADPYAIYAELRPGTASIIKEYEPYRWRDKKFIDNKKNIDSISKPMNIYEMHMGSFKTHDDGSLLSYEEIADELIPYVIKIGYTHIEIMPIMEYPFDGSWGYQVTGFFAPTSRYGDANGLKYFIDKCHKNNISVIMDWVPAHFPRDAHGLRRFDGSAVYEYTDPRLGEHKDWGTMVFDYGKPAVISFLISSAYYWASEFHFDGLRVDAVSSMLYRDYSRNDGEWIANQYGGNENLEAIEFLRQLNNTMTSEFPGFLMIAEESTAWPLVTKSVDKGGLGFSYKWNMGWMNDSLRYVAMDPYFRKDNHSLVTFLMVYAYSERYILPLSHDEVVHGKKSLIDKMFGEYDDKFSAYKTYLGYYMTMPGKKLMFMGGEFGQFLEWRATEQLEWNLLEDDKHKKLMQYVCELNNFYKTSNSLWEYEENWDGFKWINDCDSENSVISYKRMGKGKNDDLYIVANFTPIARSIYKIGVEKPGEYKVIFDSDSKRFDGLGQCEHAHYKTKAERFSDMEYTLQIQIPGNGFLVIKHE